MMRSFLLAQGVDARLRLSLHRNIVRRWISWKEDSHGGAWHAAD